MIKQFILTCALAATVAGSAAAGASAPAGTPRQVTISPTQLRIRGPVDYRPGPITFQVSAHGGEQVFHLLRLRDGYTLTDLNAAQAHGDSPAVEREVEQHVKFLGGVDVFPGTPTAFTVTLTAGTYYLGAIDRRLRLRAIHVHGAPTSGAAAPSATGAVVAHDSHWQINGTLPAHGTILVRNSGKRGHMLVLSPVKTGTTRAQLGAYLRKTHASEQAPPPPFAVAGPTVATGLLSPGAAMKFSYSLPPGEYALLTFERDPTTGKPEALEGMYTITRLH